MRALAVSPGWKHCLGKSLPGYGKSDTALDGNSDSSWMPQWKLAWSLLSLHGPVSQVLFNRSLNGKLLKLMEN